MSHPDNPPLPATGKPEILSPKERIILKLLVIRKARNQMAGSKKDQDLSISETLTLYAAARQMGITEERFNVLKTMARESAK